jgi:hypothetical protein
MKHGYRSQLGLRRRPAGGFNREHAAFLGGIAIMALLELILAAKGWS